MEHKPINVSYYPSSIISSMLFDCSEDAEHFDKVLNDFINNPEALEEFTEPVLASWSALKYHINLGHYQLMIDGKYTRELLEACERMVAGYEGLDDGDCYTPALNYIFNHILELKNLKL